MERFSNPHVKEVKRRLWDFLLWKVGYYHDAIALRKPPEDFSYPFTLAKVDNDKPKVVWIGHSTFLVEFEDVAILTDPIWSKKCSPVSFAGPIRRHEPPISLSDIPSMDFVLISHNHYDHLDKKSVLELAIRFPGITWIVPLGVKRWFARLKIENVYELAWWEKITFQKEKSKVTVAACPSQHFSGRGLFDTDRTFWNGYVVTMEGKDSFKSFYFTGDTGYNCHDFKEIGQRWPRLDLSLIPIGTYSPREFMKAVHICPDEAVQIHQDVGSLFSIGMHWKTFHLSDEALDLPPYDLYLAMQKAELPFQQFIAIDPGVMVNW
jgi:N-acyl-phosphatidylethanolamine-hydrolysing phospholipase D